MSANPEIERIVTLHPQATGVEPEPSEAVVAVATPEPLPPLLVSEAPARARPRRPWVIPVAIGVAGLIVSGTLGGFLLSTIGQRDTARHQLATTQAALATVQQQLSAAQADAATRKLTADYVRLYVVDSGRVLTDYAQVAACNAYSECRTAAQQMLNDLQAFQSDRTTVTVPPALASADSMLGDGLSAAIAGDQEFITGMDNDDPGKLKDGGHKVDAALLSIAKAETALGAGLK